MSDDTSQATASGLPTYGKLEVRKRAELATAATTRALAGRRPPVHPFRLTGAIRLVTSHETDRVHNQRRRASSADGA